MSLVARFVGAEEVIDQFKKIGLPNFSMWCKTALICQYNGDSIDEAIDIIQEEIDRNIKRKMSHECFLKIHPRQENNYTLKSEIQYNIVFRSYDSPDFAAAVNPAVANYQVLEGLNEIKSRLAAIELEREFDDEDDEDDFDDDFDDEPEDKIAGYITKAESLLNHPVVGKIIEKLFTTPGEQQTKAVTSLAGMSEQDQVKLLNQCLEKLFEKGLTLQHLVKLAEMPEDRIKSLLMFI